MGFTDRHHRGPGPKITGDNFFQRRYDYEDMTPAERELVRTEVCEDIGHEYLQTTPPGIRSAPLVVCNSCGHSGWLIAS